jgi:hypothetical protein
MFHISCLVFDLSPVHISDLSFNKLLVNKSLMDFINTAVCKFSLEFTIWKTHKSSPDFILNLVRIFSICFKRKPVHSYIMGFTRNMIHNFPLDFILSLVRVYCDINSGYYICTLVMDFIYKQSSKPELIHTYRFKFQVWISKK